MSTKNLRSVVGLTYMAVFGASIASAQDNNLSWAYHVVPKAGMTAQFEAALSAHAQWRMSNGDPWSWAVSRYETGDQFGTYSFFSGGHSWADFDAYDAGFAPQGLLHWQATVAPLIESLTTIITATNTAISKPPTGSPIGIVTVTKYQLRPGQEQRFEELITKAMNAVRDELPGHWIWRAPASGGGPDPYWEFIQFYEGWIGMQDPDPTFAAIMSEAIGQEEFQAWTEDFQQTHRGIEVISHRFRSDLAATAAN